MHLKWERSQTGTDGRSTKIVLRAVLMELNEKNGERQWQFMEDLGTIEERYLISKARDMRAFHQGLFWVGVDKKLDQLNLEAAKRTIIEALISEKIPRPGCEWALWGVICVPIYDP